MMHKQKNPMDELLAEYTNEITKSNKDFIKTIKKRPKDQKKIQEDPEPKNAKKIQESQRK